MLEFATHCVSKSIRVSPLLDTTLNTTSDVLYSNLINNKLLEKYYQWNIDTYPEHPSAHLYQYRLMEGAWKSWFEETKFDEYRRKCMNALLGKNLIIFFFDEVLKQVKILKHPQIGKTNMSDQDMAKIIKSEIKYLMPSPGNAQIFVLF